MIRTWWCYLLPLLLAGLGSCRKTPLIISTDANADDLMGLAYLVKAGVFDIKLIAVEANGFADEMFGVPNILTMLREAGCGDAATARSVAYGDRNSMLDWGAPGDLKPIKAGVDRLPQCLGLAPPTLTQLPSPEYAPRQIIRTLKAQTHRTDILLMGSFTNLAQALDLDPTIVSKIRNVYISGGVMDPFNDPTYRPTNATWPYAWKNKATGWNIFLDGLAVHKVLRSGIRSFVAMPSGTQYFLPFNRTWLLSYLESNNLKPLNASVQMNINFARCTNDVDSNIRYWDESACVMAVQEDQGMRDGPKALCTKWKTFNISMYLWPDNKYGMMMTDDVAGVPIRTCLSANSTIFHSLYWNTLTAVKSTCPKPVSQSLASKVASYVSGAGSSSKGKQVAARVSGSIRDESAQESSAAATTSTSGSGSIRDDGGVPYVVSSASATPAWMMSYQTYQAFLACIVVLGVVVGLMLVAQVAMVGYMVGSRRGGAAGNAGADSAAATAASIPMGGKVEAV